MLMLLELIRVNELIERPMGNSNSTGALEKPSPGRLCILDLPTELMAEIFCHLHDLTSIPRYLKTQICMPEPHPFKIPMCLMQVCRQWRAIAESTPLLWSTITFRQPIPVKPFSKRALRLINLWLERSGSSPLHIYYVEFETSEFCNPVLDLLLANAHRWKEVIFWIPSYRIRRLDAVKSRLPVLEDLSVWTTDREPLTEAVTGFVEVPRLRRVDLNDWFGQAPEFELPLAQLTHLLLPTSTFIVLLKARQVLASCPNLEECCIMTCDHRTLGQDSAIITLPHLRTLNTNAEGPPLRQLLQCLTSPALVDLRLQGFGRDQWNHSAFSLFMLRSKCQLKRVAFHDLDMDSLQLVEYLRMMPSLIELEIAEARRPLVTDRVLEALTIDPSSSSTSPTCPLLESIHIVRDHGSSGPHFSADALYVMARSHARLQSRAPGVRLFGQRVIESDGQDIKISYFKNIHINYRWHHLDPVEGVKKWRKHSDGFRALQAVGTSVMVRFGNYPQYTSERSVRTDSGEIRRVFGRIWRGADRRLPLNSRFA